jgi:hypothetical protein
MSDLRSNLQDYRSQIEYIRELLDRLGEDLAEDVLQIDLESGYFHKKTRQTDTN